MFTNGKQVVAGTYDGLTGRVESRDATGNTEFDQFVFQESLHFLIVFIPIP